MALEDFENTATEVYSVGPPNTSNKTFKKLAMGSIVVLDLQKNARIVLVLVLYPKIKQIRHTKQNQHFSDI